MNTPHEITRLQAEYTARINDAVAAGRDDLARELAEECSTMLAGAVATDGLPQREPPPVVAGFQPTGPGLAALAAAADQADARHAPLRVLAARPLPVWAHPVAMAPYPPEVFAGPDPAADVARDAVAALRREHPGTGVSLHGTSRSLSRALQREAGQAAMLVTGRDPADVRGTARLAGRAGVPVLTVPATRVEPGAPVVLAGTGTAAAAPAVAFAFAEAATRGVPLLACDLAARDGDPFTADVDSAAAHFPAVDVRREPPPDLTTPGTALLVLQAPARRDRAMLAGLLRDAPYPVATVPAAR